MDFLEKKMVTVSVLKALLVLANTSLAKKGLAKCLYDETVENENDRNRPFSFIAIGGSSNGSTLDGHNYTYVGSTWGKI